MPGHSISVILKPMQTLPGLLNGTQSYTQSILTSHLFFFHAHTLLLSYIFFWLSHARSVNVAKQCCQIPRGESNILL